MALNWAIEGKNLFLRLPPSVRNTNQKKFLKNIEIKKTCELFSERDWKIPKTGSKIEVFVTLPLYKLI